MILATHNGERVHTYSRWSLVILLITLIVHHLHLADNIIVMNDDGTILEQGDLQKLQTKQDRVVQKLLSSEEEHNIQDKSPPIVIPSASVTASKDLIIRQNRHKDCLRKSGDSAVYAYYFKSVGWRDSIIMLVLGALSVFCDKFPSKGPLVEL